MKHVEGYTAGENTAAQKNISTSDLIHFYGSWVWRAVYAIVDAKDFNPDPAWIADRLNIAVSAAKDAFEGLERIGAISVVDGSYKSVIDFAYHPASEIDRADMFYVHTKIRDQISERMKTKDCFSNLIFLSNKELISKFYFKFTDLIEELNAEGLKAECKDVFALELSFSKLTREQK